MNELRPSLKRAAPVNLPFQPSHTATDAARASIVPLFADEAMNDCAYRPNIKFTVADTGIKLTDKAEPGKLNDNGALQCAGSNKRGG